MSRDRVRTVSARQGSARASGAVPLFGSWRNAYAVVVVVFVVEVALFYLLGRFFA